MTARILDGAALLRLVERHLRFDVEHLLAVGGFGSPIDAPCDRLGLIKIGGGPPRLREDLWLRREARAGLWAALAGRPALRLGAWDVLHADDWSLAWSEDDRPFALWDRRGRLAWLTGDALDTRGARIDRRAISAIEARVSEAWDEARVVAVADGREHEVARKDNPGARLDPTYDGLDLFVDTDWACLLGRALASALGVDFVDRTRDA